MIRSAIATALVAAVLAAPAALASPFTDYEAAMRAAYADYRMALFATNAGKAAEAGKALAKFSGEWKGLAGLGVPPQYAEDDRFAATLDAVAVIAAKADGEIAAGKLADAHTTLEGIREEIAGLHERAGVIGFSDRMNAYHAKMEQVMEGTDDMVVLREEVAVLEFLLADVTAHPPVGADASFDALVKDVAGSIAAVRAAAEAGDPAAAKAAVANLKPPYSKLFLKFG